MFGGASNQVSSRIRGTGVMKFNLLLGFSYSTTYLKKFCSSILVLFLQMAVVLKNLTNAALLSPSEASEEFREGVIRCFKAMLLGSCLCSNKSCNCNQINVLPLPLLLEKRSFMEANPKECLLAFLRSQSAIVTVGHWLSLLLKVGAYISSVANL